jgi:hypothetical protein
MTNKQTDHSPPDIEARAVLDEQGFAVLFDLWVNNKWVGSRRTAEQCELHLTHVCGVEVEYTYRSCW